MLPIITVLQAERQFTGNLKLNVSSLPPSKKLNLLQLHNYYNPDFIAIKSQFLNFLMMLLVGVEDDDAGGGSDYDDEDDGIIL